MFFLFIHLFVGLRTGSLQKKVDGPLRPFLLVLLALMGKMGFCHVLSDMWILFFRQKVQEVGAKSSRDLFSGRSERIHRHRNDGWE